ncbi:DUF5069 domain-containing protein [Rubellicoccus peritrichatus]|uniref:DUF5069 domain-containing protein n=1 Tax=Rubellicoccus peritrichatus TaxID=3080537 RepID=A0AAQ3L7M4_9BACT|nr:DUF5069 domain-containing protein [Puniceicoccus sp. CR14]WOO40152.1 DUF5069 domain-containing protein [Puniceicoccus sp. CR14]
MSTIAEKIDAKDLSKKFPRSPREKVAGYVVAGRTLDKCRAAIAGTLGEYHYDCPLDRLFFDFTGIDSVKFQEFVATGADDAEVAAWIEQNSKQTEKREIIQWNNDLRFKRINEMPIELQEFLEGYIDEFIAPKGKTVYYWFDVYDIEEERI